MADLPFTRGPYGPSGYTSAQLPSPSQYPPYGPRCFTAYTSDQGMCYSDGVRWISYGRSPAIGNVTRANTNHWRAARGKVQAGIQNARILCCGNSITAGYYATGSTDTANMASKSYPTQLAQILTAAGLNASWQSWIGNNNEADWGSTGTDSRIVLGSWTNSGVGAFGGNVLTLGATGQTLMSFTPLTAVDTVEVFALRNSASNHITIAVDGGATLSTYTPGGPAGSPPVTHGTSGAIALGSLATHAIQANITTAVSTFLVGMIAYNSTVKEVSVLRAGWQGGTINSLINAARPYTDGILLSAPDLTLLAMTRNDATSATDITTFKSLYQTVLTACLTSGDVILVIEPMGNAPASQYAPYVAAVYDLAATNNLPVIDFTQLWDAYANITTWYADAIHPNGFAYGEMARQIAEILMQL